MVPVEELKHWMNVGCVMEQVFLKVIVTVIVMYWVVMVFVEVDLYMMSVIDVVEQVFLKVIVTVLVQL